MANETSKSYGVNVNYDGEPVGLWFDPETVEMDEHAYVSMGEDELAELGRRIVEATGTERAVEAPRCVAVAIYHCSDGGCAAFVATDKTQLLAQLADEVVRPWLTEHAEHGVEPDSIFGDVGAFLRAGDHANALAAWEAFHCDQATGEWVEIVGEVKVNGWVGGMAT